MDQYILVFDETSCYWEKNFDINLMLLSSQQMYFNNRLRAYGYVFLNEVLDALGVNKTMVGQIVGWVYTKEEGQYVDFGIKVDDSNGENPKITLNFNIQGVILDKIDWKK